MSIFSKKTNEQILCNAGFRQTHATTDKHKVIVSFWLEPDVQFKDSSINWLDGGFLKRNKMEN